MPYIGFMMDQAHTEIRTARWLVLLNLFGFCMTLFVNGMANALPLNGMTTGEISSFYPNRFVPAASTFAIWGLIYLQLLLFIAYQIRAVYREDTAALVFLRRVGPLFLIASTANSMWIVAWHHLMIELSLVLMVVLLVSLITIYRRLGIGRQVVDLPERIAVHYTFSIYLGWISVATIANATALCVHWGLAYLTPGESFWAATMIVVATGLGLHILYHKHDIAFNLVLCWAFWGIFRKQQAFNYGSFSPVALVAIGATVVLLLRMVLLLYYSRKKTDVGDI